MKHLTAIAALLLLAAKAAGSEFGVNATNYDGGVWSPYVVGAGIGVLSWLTFYFADKIIGASSFYATLAGFLGKLFARRHTESLHYYQENPPRADWGFIFVVCTILGGFLAAWSGGEFRNEWLHPMWVDRFGDGVLLRGVVGFLGGVLMAFGARLSGGCTSGHGISGTLQLNVGSWVMLLGIFAGGVATAMLLYTVL
jgi:uncharacterized protein